MTNLTPSASFDSVQELETTTVALGGPGAPMNVQAQALLNRTQYLFVQLSNLAPVATSGDYNSLINRPALGSAAYQSSGAFATAAQGAKADGAAQASALSSVAFSGSYNDLSNKPFASDAPSDGNVYGRKNGAWAIAVEGSPLINPMTTAGDIIVAGAGGSAGRLGKGVDGTVLGMVSGAQAWIDAGVLLSNTLAWTKNQYVSPSTLAYASTVTPDASATNNFELVLSGNCILANPINLQHGMVLNFCLDQDATGGWSLTLGSLYKFPGGVIPAWSTIANARNFISAYYDGTVLRCNGGVGYA